MFGEEKSDCKERGNEEMTSYEEENDFYESNRSFSVNEIA